MGGEHPLARVHKVIHAARQLVAERNDRLVDAIASSTGLSRENVILALERHLELDPRDEDLESLVQGAGSTSSVVVLLSANVFVGALRALAIACAAAQTVVVRPSRRDPAFATALVERIQDPSIALRSELDLATLEGGEVHVYGRDATIEAVRAQLRPEVQVRGHGAGLGVAWIRTSSPASANALADDVVPFDQRGCLSPRLVVMPVDQAEPFAEELSKALSARGAVVPRGTLSSEERAEAERWIATMTYAGRMHEGSDHAVAIGSTITIPPVGRHVQIVPCDPSNAKSLLLPIERAVVAMGSDDPSFAREIAPPWARRSSLGEMQRPPLDGPVDRRPF